MGRNMGKNMAEKSVPQLVDARYLHALLDELQSNPVGNNSLSATTRSLIEPVRLHRGRRMINRLRHALLADLGQAPGEWDLWDGARLDAGRRIIRNYFLYLEEVRSPFNVGAIFRVAESFGVRKIYLSPYCASPTHNRALRSAMGTVEIMQWRTASIDEALADAGQLADSDPVPLFALETGGEPLDDFAFPAAGMMIVGAEELGISGAAEASARASAGIVTISAGGAKTSLNVAVAFGIAMHNWYAQV